MTKDINGDEMEDDKTYRLDVMTGDFIPIEDEGGEGDDAA